MKKAIDILQPITHELSCQTTDTLTTIVHQIDDPDKALIVRDPQGEYVGIISPHNVLHANRHYPNTKVSQLTVKPPKIEETTDLDTIAGHMVSSQTFTLPVIKGDKVVGMVHIDAIREAIKEDEEVQSLVTHNLRIYDAVKVSEDQSIRDILAMLKNKPTSWVIMTDKEDRPKGIIHVGHLIDILFIDDNKQRFGKQRERYISWSFDTEPHELADVQLTHIINPYIAPKVDHVNNAEIVNQLLKNGTYAVITTENEKVNGIVTIRELCGAFENAQTNDEVSISIKRPSDSVNDHEFLVAQEDLRHFAQKMSQRLPLQRIEVGVEEPKYTTAQTAIFNTAITVIPYTKGSYYAQGHEKYYSLSVRSALKQIEKQFQRDHQERTNYDMPSMGEVTQM